MMKHTSLALFLVISSCFFADATGESLERACGARFMTVSTEHMPRSISICPTLESPHWDISKPTTDGHFSSYCCTYGCYPVHYQRFWCDNREELWRKRK